MAAIDFPASPTVSQVFSTGNGALYQWNGTVWVALSNAVVPLVVTTVFTASGTWTPNGKMVYAALKVLGGGGAGGSVASATTNFVLFASGGGAGSMSEATVSKATAGASQVVTIGAAGAPGATGNNPGGAGGDTSVGTLCIGKGGAGGQGQPAGGVNCLGGLGGIAGTGDQTGTGQPGGSGSSTASSTFVTAGAGGSSPWGGGGRAVQNTTSSAGEAATGFGAGGSGATCFNGAVARAGGPGTAGKAIIIEYCMP